MIKKITLLIALVVLSGKHNAQNQEIIWFEDFNSYANLFGIEGSGSGVVNIGGYDPATFTKWQLVEVSGAALVNFSDFVAVFSNSTTLDKHLRAQDTDLGVDWITENIDISNHSDVTVSLSVEELGDHEDSEIAGGDWFDVYYSFDNGTTYTRLPNWNSLGNADHTLTGDTSHGATCTVDADFMSTKIYFSIPDSETSLRLRITLKNGATTENLNLDDVYVTGIDNSILNIADVKEEETFVVYPNPASTRVNLSFLNNNIQSIKVYDVNQRLVMQINEVNSEDYTLNVQNLNSGIYFIQVNDYNLNIKNHKLIIQ